MINPSIQVEDLETKMKELRKYFPFFSHSDSIYLDSAATALRPQVVLDAMNDYYNRLSANVHRGLYTESEEATSLYENSRDLLRQWIGASSREEVIFTKGTTEGINLIARSFGETELKPGDVILLTTMEHHSNIVPWQLLAERKDLKIEVIPITEAGEIDLEIAEKAMHSRVKLFSFVHASNTLGTVNPAKRLISLAQSKGITTVVDGAQAMAHFRVNVTELGADFYCFSGHKMFGPTGVGVLYGRKEILNRMPPFLGGGDMIDQVSFEKTTFNSLPYKFEAGTPPIAEVIGLGAAVQFLSKLNWTDIENYEAELKHYAMKELATIEGLKLIGRAKHRLPVFSFALDQIHTQDLATFLSRDRLALRTGHHCTKPLMDFYGVVGTTRMACSFYNTKEEISLLIRTLKKAERFFKDLV